MKIKSMLSYLIHIPIRLIKVVLNIFLYFETRIKEGFLNRIDLEHYSKFLFLSNKYIKKILYPSILISLFIDVIYIVVGNYVFNVVYPVIFFFIFLGVFIIKVILGCVKGESYKEQYTEDN